MPRKKSRTAYYGTPTWYTASSSLTPTTPVVVEAKKKQAIFANHFHSETVCILVGRESAPYYLHSEVLEQRSPYFAKRAAFLAKAQSKDSEKVHLGDVARCEVFDLLVEYLYKDEYTAPSELSTVKKCEMHVQLYRLAEYLMVDDLKDTALDKLTTLLKENTHAIYGRALNSQEILRLLTIAYEDNIVEQCSTPSVEEEDGEEQHDDGTLSKMATDISDNRDIAVPTIPTQAFEEQPGAEAQFTQPDPLRRLIARYAAVQLEYLQNEPAFYKILVNGGDMVRDIVSFVRPASTM
ncbi:hypothetical protein H2198_006769 [Neophaeococcomyces mojaviensis]|uniref:Uncharacterized protein n=1 Tax=Neophaeococcomyces mojaviensis TaxID=3383035 RepID=A0ACC3A1Z5_9EURO|nr:hypothetical protein H2198_006769 [Knufia sp. JES_112]